MKHGAKMLSLLAGSLAFCEPASAVTTDSPSNPYQTIVDRNVFSLKPPPPPPGPEENKPKPVKITLTGITTILGNKRVLMKAPAPPGKPGETPKPEISYILTEGQRDGDVEVLEINDKTGDVKLNNAGTIVTLNIEKDGPKLPATQPPPAVGGAPLPAGAIPAPMPGAAHAAGTPAGGNTGFTMPTRTLRLPSQTGGATPGVATPPGINPMFNPTPIPQTAAQQQQQLANPNVEQQILMMEAQRELSKRNPNLVPPLPPTVLTPGNEEPAPGSGPPGIPTLPRPVGLPPVPQ
jgi:hypothetical protein